jgi:membrane associated rhomboid family serine protease
MHAAMTTPSPMAGGFFLILPIVAGFFWGLASGRAMQGAVIGLGVGIVLALVVWLFDRARQRR